MTAYIDIRTNIMPSQLEQAEALAGELGESLSAVVRRALRSYLASDASDVVYMTYHMYNDMAWQCLTGMSFHRKSCHHVSNNKGTAVLRKDTKNSAQPCKVCKP